MTDSYQRLHPSPVELKGGLNGGGRVTASRTHGRSSLFPRRVRFSPASLLPTRISLSPTVYSSFSIFRLRSVRSQSEKLAGDGYYFEDLLGCVAALSSAVPSASCVYALLVVIVEGVVNVGLNAVALLFCFTACLIGNYNEFGFGGRAFEANTAQVVLNDIQT